MFQILLTAKVSKNTEWAPRDRSTEENNFLSKKGTEMRHYSIQIIKMKLVL